MAANCSSPYAVSASWPGSAPNHSNPPPGDSNEANLASPFFNISSALGMSSLKEVVLVYLQKKVLKKSLNTSERRNYQAVPYHKPIYTA
jgi:hypothetical protein